MNFLRNTGFAKPRHVLHSKLQVTHIARVLGGERFVRPERNVKGVSSHADGSQEESQEESRQEEDQEGEEEEVTSLRQPARFASARFLLWPRLPDAQASAGTAAKLFWASGLAEKAGDSCSHRKESRQANEQFYQPDERLLRQPKATFHFVAEIANFKNSFFHEPSNLCLLSKPEVGTTSSAKALPI